MDAPIHRVNYAFRGVNVPAGSHVVTFVYRPASFRYGLYASLAAIVTCVLLLATTRRPSS